MISRPRQDGEPYTVGFVDLAAKRTVLIENPEKWIPGIHFIDHNYSHTTACIHWLQAKWLINKVVAKGAKNSGVGVLKSKKAEVAQAPPPPAKCDVALVSAAVAQTVLAMTPSACYPGNFSG